VEFQGENWACSVAAVVIFPVAKAAEGESFLKFVEAAAASTSTTTSSVSSTSDGRLVAPSEEDTKDGYLVFERDYMKDVFYNDTPAKTDAMRSPTRVRRSRASMSR